MPEPEPASSPGAITTDEPFEGQPEGQDMTILEHLEELRSRLLKAVLAIIVTTSISAVGAQESIGFLARPIGGIHNLQATEVTEPIGVYMRVALLGGVILAMPVIVYQLLMFIVPGLTSKEKRWVYLAVPFASLLFVAGIAFAYYVMLPSAINFLVSNVIPGIDNRPKVSNYVSFVTNLMFWIGVSFETPLLIFVLAKLNIVTASQLARQWRIAVVVIAIIAAVVTPTVDPVNMSILMVPLFLLYWLSVFLAWLATRGQKT
ncbi:MAG TPA: twin-arginine translocase subunit TatC [Anaerolineaceae bacterium]|nr:twin-arginine translocase subunit TatC [Anaerolineaceae bacterium]